MIVHEVKATNTAVTAGDALFQTHENLEHLAMMEAVLGPIPKAMAQAAKGTHDCFVGRDSRLNWPASASKRSIRCGLDCVPCSVAYASGQAYELLVQLWQAHQPFVSSNFTS